MQGPSPSLPVGRSRDSRLTCGSQRNSRFGVVVIILAAAVVPQTVEQKQIGEGSLALE